MPEHHQHNEQVTHILEGALKFAIDGQEIVVRAGEVLCIPSNMPHEAWVVEDTLDLPVKTGSTNPTITCAWASPENSELRRLPSPVFRLRGLHQCFLLGSSSGFT